MFPASFADRVIETYTKRGETVLDPFAGRGTAVFSAATQGRRGIGIELNPVGWIYARTKLAPATEDEVGARFEQLGAQAYRYVMQARRLPSFFHHCFNRDVRRFLLAARAQLDWRRTVVDRTAMALLLVHMHGKRESSLSNQMRQAKSMSPDYSVTWWKKRDLDPPAVDPVDFMLNRLKWRYAKGVPTVTDSHAYLGDNLEILPRLSSNLQPSERARLLFTSPPYFGLTNYHYDQWLRLWLLGGPANALRVPGKNRGKFEHHERYKTLLVDTFTKAKHCLKRTAVIYVRTGSDKITRDATRDALRKVFPRKRIEEHDRPFEGPTQTALFENESSHSGEIDFVLS
jgi:hypothetical protein